MYSKEIGRFDIKHCFFTSSTSHGLHDLRNKRYKRFEGCERGAPHGYVTPFSFGLSSWVSGLSNDVYIFSVLALVLSEIDQRQEASLFCFLFLWIWPRKIRQTSCWIFQICRDCNHKNIGIPKLSVSYQTSLSEEFKKIFFFIIMSSNHEEMFVWNASIWVGGPCTYHRYTYHRYTYHRYTY